MSGGFGGGARRACRSGGVVGVCTCWWVGVVFRTYVLVACGYRTRGRERVLNVSQSRSQSHVDGDGRSGLAVLDAVREMALCVDVVARADLDGLSDVEVEEVLDRLRRPIVQLEGVRSRAAAVSQRRRLRARPDLPVGQVIGDHRKQLGEQQRMAPGEVDRALQAGRAAELGGLTDQALRDGELGVSQARTIARILPTLVGALREEVEAELVALARVLDPIAFGRAARRVQGRVQPEMLAGAQRRQECARRFSGTDTEDGGFVFSGLLTGTAAETARVALQAFRRPDTPDEHRTAEQRGADAFEQLCAAALAAGDAPTRHGVRPQVMVLVDAVDLAALADTPERAVGRFVASGQPISGRSLRHLVNDSRLLRVVLDAEGVPVEVSTTVRTVPAGLWRGLLVRDGGCVWPGCDAPASWCDVAHGRDAFTDGGKLCLDNAMLLCRRHHRRFDAGSRRVHIDGTTITFPDLPGRTPQPPEPPERGPGPPERGPGPPERGPGPPERGPGRPELPDPRPEPPGPPDGGPGLPERGSGSPERGSGSPERGSGSPERGPGLPAGPSPQRPPPSQRDRPTPRGRDRHRGRGSSPPDQQLSLDDAEDR